MGRVKDLGVRAGLGPSLEGGSLGTRSLLLSVLCLWQSYCLFPLTLEFRRYVGCICFVPVVSVRVLKSGSGPHREITGKEAPVFSVSTQNASQVPRQAWKLTSGPMLEVLMATREIN